MSLDNLETLLIQLEGKGREFYSPSEMWNYRLDLLRKAMNEAYLAGRRESDALAREFNTESIIKKIEDLAK